MLECILNTVSQYFSVLNSMFNKGKWKKQETHACTDHKDLPAKEPSEFERFLTVIAPEVFCDWSHY